MADIEKVIKGIEQCLSRYIDGLCDDCPYMGESDKSYMIPMKCKEIIMRDALELLKEKEKAKVIFMPHEGVYQTECGNCGQYLDKAYSVCQGCGKKLDWNSNQT